MVTKLERDFQAKLIKDLRILFPDCEILKNDANYRPGIPDLIILHEARWAMLECKKSANEPTRPNQLYYVEWAQRESFGAFIYPENKGQVLEELVNYFK